MVTVKFTENFANKLINDEMVVDTQLASQLIVEGVAVLAGDQTGEVAKTVLSKNKSKE